MLFNGAWSQEGHWASCTTLFSFKFHIIRSETRQHIKWDISLVIADGHFDLLQGVCAGKHTHIITPKCDGVIICVLLKRSLMVLWFRLSLGCVVLLSMSYLIPSNYHPRFGIVQLSMYYCLIQSGLENLR